MPDDTAEVDTTGTIILSDGSSATIGAYSPDEVEALLAVGHSMHIIRDPYPATIPRLGPSRVVWTTHDLSALVDSLSMDGYTSPPAQASITPTDFSETVETPLNGYIATPPVPAGFNRGEIDAFGIESESREVTAAYAIAHGDVTIMKPEHLDTMMWNYLWANYHDEMIQMFDIAREMPGFVGERMHRVNNIITAIGASSSIYATLIQDWVEYVSAGMSTHSWAYSEDDSRYVPISPNRGSIEWFTAQPYTRNNNSYDILVTLPDYLNYIKNNPDCTTEDIRSRGNVGTKYANVFLDVTKYLLEHYQEKPTFEPLPPGGIRDVKIYRKI